MANDTGLANVTKNFKIASTKKNSKTVTVSIAIVAQTISIEIAVKSIVIGRKNLVTEMRNNCAMKSVEIVMRRSERKRRVNEMRNIATAMKCLEIAAVKNIEILSKRVEIAPSK